MQKQGSSDNEQTGANDKCTSRPAYTMHDKGFIGFSKTEMNSSRVVRSQHQEGLILWVYSSPLYNMQGFISSSTCRLIHIHCRARLAHQGSTFKLDISAITIGETVCAHYWSRALETWLRICCLSRVSPQLKVLTLSYSMECFGGLYSSMQPLSDSRQYSSGTRTAKSSHVMT